MLCRQLTRRSNVSVRFFTSNQRVPFYSQESLSRQLTEAEAELSILDQEIKRKNIHIEKLTRENSDLRNILQQNNIHQNKHEIKNVNEAVIALKRQLDVSRMCIDEIDSLINLVEHQKWLNSRG